jgi:hypothetical protein
VPSTAKPKVLAERAARNCSRAYYPYRKIHKNLERFLWVYSILSLAGTILWLILFHEGLDFMANLADVFAFEALLGLF